MRIDGKQFYGELREQGFASEDTAEIAPQSKPSSKPNPHFHPERSHHGETLPIYHWQQNL
jgi:hypothetical protein